MYVPNGKNTDGSNKFDKVLITEDVSLDASDGASTVSDWVIFYEPNNKSARNSRTISNFSGPTAPTVAGTYAVWYDTTDNLIKYTNDAGASWTTPYASFPLCLFTRTEGTASSIDQVFNGFGYIGSTVFALPGIKGLIPNGRNADGTPKNSEFVTTKVTIYYRTYPTTTRKFNYFIYNNNTITDNGMLYVQDEEPNSWNYQVWFDTSSNLIKYNNNGTVVAVHGCVFGSTITTSSVISTFQPKTAFNALDYNDRAIISGCGMPGNVFVDLILGASGSEYTAQVNGYVLLERGSTSGNKYINLYNNNSQLGVIGTTIAGVANARVFLPVKRGDVFKASYSADSTNPIFKLIYADGEI